MSNFKYDKYGDEVLYNGMTGRQMECNIFIGPTYYMRLKHIVQDKMHSRREGINQVINRQPSEGRARDGGQKIGEMERDVVISHGVSSFFKESYNELESVRYAMTVTSIFFIPSVISFLLVAKVLPRDWKAAEERNLKLAN